MQQLYIKIAYLSCKQAVCTAEQAYQEGKHRTDNDSKHCDYASCSDTFEDKLVSVLAHKVLVEAFFDGAEE